MKAWKQKQYLGNTLWWHEEMRKDGIAQNHVDHTKMHIKIY